VLWIPCSACLGTFLCLCIKTFAFGPWTLCAYFGGYLSSDPLQSLKVLLKVPGSCHDTLRPPREQLYRNENWVVFGATRKKKDVETHTHVYTHLALLSYAEEQATKLVTSTRGPTMVASQGLSLTSKGPTKAGLGKQGNKNQFVNKNVVCQKYCSSLGRKSPPQKMASE